MISIDQWRSCIGLWSNPPKQKRNKSFKVYQQNCNLKNCRNVYFQASSIGQKLIKLNHLLFLTNTLIFLCTFLFVWTPYIILHQKGNDAATEQNNFCCGSNLDTQLFQTASSAVSSSIGQKLIKLNHLPFLTNTLIFFVHLLVCVDTIHYFASKRQSCSY